MTAAEAVREARWRQGLVDAGAATAALRSGTTASGTLRLALRALGALGELEHPWWPRPSQPTEAQLSAERRAAAAAADAADALEDALLTRPDLLARPAAARLLLAPDAREPRPPDPGAVDLPVYAQWALRNAHAELGRPRRWVSLAANRWAAAHGVDSARARAAALAAVPDWEDELAQRAALLPATDVPLAIAASHARAVPWTYTFSHPRLTLAARLLARHAEPGDASPRYVLPERTGGLRLRPAPAGWAAWLTGPVAGYTLFPLLPPDPVPDAAALALTWRLWDRGRGTLGLPVAFRAAVDVLAPAAATRPA